jgi:hypothetical protein
MMTFNPLIVCKDGFTMSVQACEGHYCIPRQDKGPHTHMEGGFPSDEPRPQLAVYAENRDDLCETVYPYVPRKVFEREFELHGGIVEGKLPE